MAEYPSEHERGIAARTAEAREVVWSSRGVVRQRGQCRSVRLSRRPERQHRQDLTPTRHLGRLEPIPQPTKHFRGGEFGHGEQHRLPPSARRRHGGVLDIRNRTGRRLDLGDARPHAALFEQVIAPTVEVQVAVAVEMAVVARVEDAFAGVRVTAEVRSMSSS
ncbi:hypothetical protein ACWEVD_19155 [Nocardia thailandica]